MCFILGSTGQLGSHFKFLLPKFEYISRKDLDFSNNWDQYEQKIKELKPKTVINCTAYTKVDLAEKEEKEASLVNVENVKLLAEFSKKYKYKLIHFSTDYVFDGFFHQPYTEKNKPSPGNIYGKSKREGEKIVLGLGPRGLVIRTSWLFGPGKSNFVKAIVKKLKKGIDLTVVDDQKGCPTYTKDLVLATLALISQEKHGLYHFCNSGITSWYDFALEIKKLLKVENKISPIKTSSLTLQAHRPKNSALCCDKYLKRTGKKIRPWQEALDEYLNEIAII